jgi:hypothetical protein
VLNVVMPSVTNKPFMLSVFMLNVVILGVVMLNVVRATLGDCPILQLFFSPGQSRSCLIQCHYVNCCYGECRGTIPTVETKVCFRVKSLRWTNNQFYKTFLAP